MVDTCTSGSRQGAELVEYSGVSAHQQGHNNDVGPEPPYEGEPFYEQPGKLEPAGRTQQLEQRTEVDSTQHYVTADSEQLKRRYSNIGALERQLQQFSFVSAVLRQRLLDTEATRSRLLERFQLERILRAKEAGAKAEALNRRIQQLETEAAWRDERNSFARESAFQILHWRLAQKKRSEAVTRLHKQQNKLHKEIARYAKADVLSRVAKQLSSLPVSHSVAHQEVPLSGNSGGPGGVEDAASKARGVTVKLESGYTTRIVGKKGAIHNRRYSTPHLAGGTYHGGRLHDSYVSKSSPATGEPAPDRVLSQDNRPLASRFASADFLENEDRRMDTNKGRLPPASGRRCAMYNNSTGAADPIPVSRSSHFFPSDRSPQMLQGFTYSREAGDPLLDKPEHSYDPRESFHLQLLALRYKQEMAALELQHVSRSRPSVPQKRRCQEECISPAELTESGPRSCSTSSAAAPLSPPWTARSQFGGLRTAHGERSPRTQASKCSNVASPETASEQPCGSREAEAQWRAATANVNSISAGATCSRHTVECLVKQGTMPRAPLFPCLPTPKCINEAVTSQAAPVEVRPAPIIVSSDTCCPPAAVAHSSPSNRTSVSGSTKNAVVDENTRPLVTAAVARSSASNRTSESGSTKKAVADENTRPPATADLPEEDPTDA